MFYEFLAKQFCQESLQFYEIVKEWKACRKNKSANAILIAENVSPPPSFLVLFVFRLFMLLCYCYFLLLFIAVRYNYALVFSLFIGQFISESGVCQINTSALIRGNILRKIQHNEYPDSLFDDALDVSNL